MSANKPIGDGGKRPSHDADLPHGATGIRVGKFSVSFGEDKIVVPLPGQPRHLTVHLGGWTGTVDLHLTHEKKLGRERHDTLLQISKESLDRVFEAFAEPAMSALRGAARPLRPGWMFRRGLVPVLGFPRDDELAAVTVNRRGKLEVDPGALESRIYIPETFEQLYSSPEGTRFGVHALNGDSLARRLGTGFVIGAGTNARLWWASNRRVCHAEQLLRRQLVDLLKKHADAFQTYPWI